MSTEPEIDPEDDFMPIGERVIRDRIIHVLGIYPRLSPSMLQVGIGTAISPKMWHPVLDKLIEEGIVGRMEHSARGPTGRDQTYHIIALTRQLRAGN